MFGQGGSFTLRKAWAGAAWSCLGLLEGRGCLGTFWAICEACLDSLRSLSGRLGSLDGLSEQPGRPIWAALAACAAKLEAWGLVLRLAGLIGSLGEAESA